MEEHTRGSEWRKWDLHVHAPGTKLSDGYAKNNGAVDLDQFCQIVHDSDVAAIGIADYFSLDGYFAAKERYHELFPGIGKLLLPNLELRLPVAVNRAAQEVNIHLIFHPRLTRELASKFLGRLNTAATDGPDRTAITCADLASQDQFESATVSLDAIRSAIRETFGDHATAPGRRQDHLLVIASAKGDGIRPGGSGVQRKLLLTDEIDKFSDAFFANTGSRDYFLTTDRLETSELAVPKPVFDGCDAHTFPELKSALGKQVSEEGRQRNVTWIKADLTYEGLLQTLVEPSERVAMQATEPDPKEPYKVIRSIKFSGTSDFPAKLVLNRNLNSIIGSRSSGKSALLAHIAHAVDPSETIRLQVQAHGLGDPQDAGPAAGFFWHEVSAVKCEVEWESGEDTKGKVIYIPQNSLYTLSEKPGEITQKISPALFRTYPEVKAAYDGAAAKVVAANSAIKKAVDDWFRLAQRIEERDEEIKDLGDKGAISAERDRLQASIDRIRTRASLTDADAIKYEAVSSALDDKATRLAELSSDLEQLRFYVVTQEGASGAASVPNAVEVVIAIGPADAELPESVASHVEQIRSTAVEDLIAKIESQLVAAVIRLGDEQRTIRDEVSTIESENAELIARHEANEELAGVVADHKKQVARLDDVRKCEQIRDRLIAEQEESGRAIAKGIDDRRNALSGLVEVFDSGERVLVDLKFGIEIDVPLEVVEHASLGFSQRTTNTYVKNKGDLVSYQDAQGDPTAFLRALHAGAVKLNKAYDASAVAATVLTVTEDIRFSAELDSDRIGGFSRSSMTPGKQALFALTLILNESQEPWPLLIDQPEDDLDSRSMYDTIVPYLMARKKERQIIMVSHNANLVIGSDSELVIVANRHGDDRPNDAGRTFEYRTGALENSQVLDSVSPTALGRFGIREHACEILDGGEEAFQKRRNKYKI